MTYVMSDIHGRYEAFLRMLSLIEFAEDDMLFLVGDMLDRGEAPLSLLLDISYRSNVFATLGDCEYNARRVLDFLFGGGPSVSAWEIEGWLASGGETTLAEMEALGLDRRQSVLDYLAELPVFEAAFVGGRNHIMVHGGLAGFSPRRRMESYRAEEVIREAAPFGRRYYKNSCVLTGHVPTYRMGEYYRGRMIVSPYQIALDCGAAEGIKLGCYCMESGEEFYVSLKE